MSSLFHRFGHSGHNSLQVAAAGLARPLRTAGARPGVSPFIRLTALLSPDRAANMIRRR